MMIFFKLNDKIQAKIVNDYLQKHAGNTIKVTIPGNSVMYHKFTSARNDSVTWENFLRNFTMDTFSELCKILCGNEDLGVEHISRLCYKKNPKA